MAKAGATVQVQKATVNTLVGIFEETVARLPNQAALSWKQGDQWKSHTYAAMKDLVANAACGLMDLGVRKGDRVAIFSKNRPEWAISDWAIVTSGAVAVPIYDTLTAEKAEYILRDSNAKVVLVQSVDHLNKIRSARRRLKDLDAIVIMDEVFEKSLESEELNFAELLSKGREYRKRNAQSYERASSAVRPDDVASIVYTSGTTGDPKGAILTHGNLASNVVTCSTLIPFEPGDISLSFLPLSHVFERMGGHFLMFKWGGTVAYAESIEKVAENMPEVKPHLMFSVPRLYEKLYARVKGKVAEDSFLKRKIFNWAVGVGRQHSLERYTLKVSNPSTDKKFKRADHLVFSKIRVRTGGRLKFFVSGGAPLAKEIEEFFHAVNLPILQGYGLTETSPVVAVNTFDNLRFGSVGRPIPGADIKIAPDGEILVKGPMVFKGYHHKPEETKAAFTADGYFKTGDIGKLDEDGFLFITDRKKELLVMSNGKKVAPQPIENQLKTKRGIGMAVLLGDNQKYIGCLISPDLEALKAIAHEMKIDEAGPAKLVEHPEVVKLVQSGVDDVNAGLARYEQIKRFRILPKELSMEGGELTPTMKVKRRVVSEKYRDLITAIFADGGAAD